jgi:cysteinyl-tRNA synthetase
MNGRPGQRAGGSALAPFNGMAMELKLYDTLAREKRAFVPIDPHNVRMYVCGPTVYDFAHIGNARPVIVFDVLFRLLRHLYGADHVTYVRNITDVDDKINARAAERGISIRELTEVTYANYQADVAALGCLPPTIEPRATEHIEEMKTLISRLVAAGHAYVADDHVLFDVPSMPDYGKLARRPLDEMIAGTRVEVAPYKRDPMDFVLWKPSKPGEPAWPSPCGIASPGRPGWHIECSAMSWKHLGETFDIHGGGIDLVFPHHENEIAQSRCAFHTGVMANYWMHNGFLQVEGEKMSKSLGNFVTIRELLETKRFGNKEWNGDVLRAAMLTTHYRQPIDWTARLLEQTEARLERWNDFAVSWTNRHVNRELEELFFRAIWDELNTPEAFSILDRAVGNEDATDADKYTVYRIMKRLGFDPQRTEAKLVAEHFKALTRKLQKFSRSDWMTFFKAAGDSGHGANNEAKLIASLEALSTVFDLIQNSVPSSSWRGIFEEHKYEPTVSHSKNIYADSARAREVFKTIFNSLGSFSQGDWNNFSIIAAGDPVFRNKRVKPQAQILFSMLQLDEDWFEIKKGLPKYLQQRTLNEIAGRLVELARPAENPFEVRVRQLIVARNEARKGKNFAESDRIRDELRALGVVLKDSKDGTTWELAR